MITYFGCKNVDNLRKTEETWTKAVEITGEFSKYRHIEKKMQQNEDLYDEKCRNCGGKRKLFNEHLQDDEGITERWSFIH